MSESTPLITFFHGPCSLIQGRTQEFSTGGQSQWGAHLPSNWGACLSDLLALTSVWQLSEPSINWGTSRPPGEGTCPSGPPGGSAPADRSENAWKLVEILRPPRPTIQCWFINLCKIVQENPWFKVICSYLETLTEWMVLGGKLVSQRECQTIWNGHPSLDHKCILRYLMGIL